MKAEIQWFDQPAGCLRAWQDEAASYGSNYQRSATVRRVDEDTIEIHGLVERSSPSEPVMTSALWRAVQAECKRQKISRIVFVRYRKNEVISKEIKVK